MNTRKEFYSDVELEEIEVFVRQRGLSAQFVKIPEAREYRENFTVGRGEEGRRSYFLNSKRQPPRNAFQIGVGVSMASRYSPAHVVVGLSLQQ